MGIAAQSILELIPEEDGIVFEAIVDLPCEDEDLFILWAFAETIGAPLTRLGIRTWEPLKGKNVAVFRMPSLAFLQAALVYVCDDNAQSFCLAPENVSQSDLLRMHFQGVHAIGIPFGRADFEDYQDKHPALFTLHDLFHAVLTSLEIRKHDQTLMSLLGLAILESIRPDEWPDRDVILSCLTDLSWTAGTAGFVEKALPKKPETSRVLDSFRRLILQPL